MGNSYSFALVLGKSWKSNDDVDLDGDVDVDDSVYVDVDNDDHLAGLHDADRLDRFDEEQSSTHSQGRPMSSIWLKMSCYVM